MDLLLTAGDNLNIGSLCCRWVCYIVRDYLCAGGHLNSGSIAFMGFALLEGLPSHHATSSSRQQPNAR
ncbi:hypothetical protein D5086_029461 [Populus alba]|uniref:Uncharacterized protein n=1 Tax=Populus alba TaxID=43335 RepID=A0ACC4AUG9_POPAL